MKFQEYFEACKQFAADTCKWGGIDPYKYYTTSVTGWTESCDNDSGGIDVSWAFHTKVTRADALRHYKEARLELLRLADDDEWDEEQRSYIDGLFEDKALEKVYKVRRADGGKVDKTYDELCIELGFSPECTFVKITTAGTISFTVGKPDEIRALWVSVRDAGFVPSKAFADTIQKL